MIAVQRVIVDAASRKAMATVQLGVANAAGGGKLQEITVDFDFDYYPEMQKAANALGDAVEAGVRAMLRQALSTE